MSLYWGSSWNLCKREVTCCTNFLKLHEHAMAVKATALLEWHEPKLLFQPAHTAFRDFKSHQHGGEECAYQAHETRSLLLLDVGLLISGRPSGLGPNSSALRSAENVRHASGCATIQIQGSACQTRCTKMGGVQGAGRWLRDVWVTCPSEERPAQPHVEAGLARGPP